LTHPSGFTGLLGRAGERISGAGVGGRWTALNPAGKERKYEALETYGLLTTDYQHNAAPKIVDLLRSVGAFARKDWVP
jgi:hypothetical protein